jgi:hypothetical protein
MEEVLPTLRAPFSLKSDPSVSKVVQQMPLLDWSISVEESYTQAISRKIGCQSMWIDTHLLEIKIEATYGTKDDPVSSHIPDVLTINPRPRLPTKVSFKGGSHPDT